MRMLSLGSVLVGLLLSQGCFIYVGVNDDEGRHHDDEPGEFWDDDWEDGDDTASVEDSWETGVQDEPSGPTVDVWCDPGEVPAGVPSIVVVTIDGEATVDDVVGLDFGEGITVLDVFVSDGEIIVAIEVDADVSGSVDVTIDFGDLGTTTVEGVLIVTGDSGDAGDGGGDGEAGGGGDAGDGTDHGDPADCP